MRSVSFGARSSACLDHNLKGEKVADWGLRLMKHRFE